MRRNAKMRRTASWMVVAVLSAAVPLGCSDAGDGSSAGPPAGREGTASTTTAAPSTTPEPATTSGRPTETTMPGDEGGDRGGGPSTTLPPVEQSLAEAWAQAIQAFFDRTGDGVVLAPPAEQCVGAAWTRRTGMNELRALRIDVQTIGDRPAPLAGLGLDAEAARPYLQDMTDCGVDVANLVLDPAARSDAQQACLDQRHLSEADAEAYVSALLRAAADEVSSTRFGQAVSHCRQR